MRVRSFLLGLFYGVGLYIILPGIFIHLNNYLSLPVLKINFLITIGLILIGFGIIFFFYLSGLFIFIGKGTPVPIEPPIKLVITGPYKYTRNPMYLNHLVIFLGLFLVYGYTSLLIYLILAWIVLHILVIKWEEPQLEKRFGKDYLDYMEKVPRWIPKFK